MGFFADDRRRRRRLSSTPSGGRRYRGRAEIRSFVVEHLAGEIRVDLTKKQVAQNSVAWTVSAPASDEPVKRAEGVAEAVFRGRQIESLRLGDGR